MVLLPKMSSFQTSHGTVFIRCELPQVNEVTDFLERRIPLRVGGHAVCSSLVMSAVALCSGRRCQVEQAATDRSRKHRKDSAVPEYFLGSVSQ